MMIIRRIEAKDDAAVERVIRDCLIEFGANHAGCAWEDDLSHFSVLYASPGSAYWVAEEDGRVIAGVGIGGVSQHSRYGRVCELQKMYCLPPYRGSGISQRLLDEALAFAAKSYDCVYLETFGNMTAAQRFYARNGFRRIDEALMQTGHSTCDVRMALWPLRAN